MPFLLSLFACLTPPCDTSVDVSPPHEGWSPVLEDELRLTQADLSWTAADGATVDEAATGCSATPCLSVVAPGEATAPTVLNRADPYRLSLVVSSDEGLTVSLTQTTTTAEEVTIFAEEVPAGADLPLDVDFALAAAGADVTIHVRPVHTASVVGLELHGTQWANVGFDSPAAPLQLGLLIHVEDNDAFRADEPLWRAKATVLEGLSGVLHAHGAGLTIQADASFFAGVAAWEPDWVADRLAEGASFSAHLHYTTGGDDVFRQQIQDARRALSTYGVTLQDLNGGYTLGSWGVAAEEGYVSMTALKDPDTQQGFPLYYNSPWRPPDGANTDDLDEFVIDDPAGPLVYLPGMVGREADHSRWPEWAERVLSQAVGHTDPAATNQWYFLSHVDAFGPADDAALAVYLSDGSFEADLTYYDAFFSSVTDPLVADGALTYASPDDMAAAYLGDDEGCK